MENRRQFIGVCNCEVGEYINHLITNYSLRRAFKYIVNETCKLAMNYKCSVLYKTQNKPFSKQCNLFKRASELKSILHEKQFVLTQVPTHCPVLSEEIFMPKQQVTGKQVFQSKLMLHKIAKGVIFYSIPVSSFPCIASSRPQHKPVTGDHNIILLFT